MTVTAPPRSGSARTGSLRTRGDTIRELQSRISGMQATKLDTRAVPTQATIAQAMGDELREGAAYTVDGSTSLLMAMLAGPSRAGLWCGVVGLPDFGVEAAARSGIDLDRLVLVPRPGAHWLAVVAALVDVIPVVAVHPPERVGATDAARLAARLRERGSVLIADAPWPQSEARLRVEEIAWTGLENGHGALTARTATVLVSGRTSLGHPRRSRIWLPDASSVLRRVHEEQEPVALFAERAAG